MVVYPWDNSVSRLSFRRSRSVNCTNSSTMVISVVVLNELKGKLELVEKKERILEDFRVDKSTDEDHIKTNIYVEI